MKRSKKANHVHQLQVSLSGKPVGKLGLSKDGTILFQYLQSWINAEFGLSTFMSFDSKPQAAKGLLFRGLHGVFADSLPDGWGLFLMDREFKKQLDWNPNEVTPLDRLAYIGSRGMGALEYAPIYEQETIEDKIDLGLLASSVDEVLKGKEQDVLRQLIIQGGSPGGARPKVTIARSNISDVCLSGFETLPEDYSHWIVKFRSEDDPKDMGRIERAYAEMAESAGVEMPYSELITVSHGKNTDDFFAVERFDRYGKNGKVHVHSLSGLMYADFRSPCMDYDSILQAVRTVTKDHSQVVNAFRLMVFNVLAHNKDDHVKNFAFVYEKNKGWKLSPAFDLTHSQGVRNQHTSAISGSGNPNIDDVLKIGKKHSIANALRIVGEVRNAVSKWPSIAKELGVSKKLVTEIKKSILDIDSKFTEAPKFEFQKTDGHDNNSKP
jgi:serine/threonine-protein kinase HipA